ncbi:uncharacterized protein [Miscanthus floridulus]|uniref:uncharacterized protein n=1 Tax=Miscanthus floridulus TaxID=154761 RepID=UPI003459E097
MARSNFFSDRCVHIKKLGGIYGDELWVVKSHDYEAYRVPPEGPAANSVTHDDPYDYIYQNLPERHKLRKVPDCSYCADNNNENHVEEGDNDVQEGDVLAGVADAAQSAKYQWAVDMYIKIESMRLDWYSNPEHQKLIRVELYQGLVDVISAGETQGSKVGKRIVLPRSFPGCDRDMQQRFLNAMAIIQRFGKPDYFITMTCNPYWEEITSNLEPGQDPQDRPELVARVYNCHINVEACASIKAVKYLFKYVYKGHDQASFSVNADQNDRNDGVINEIQQYRNARYISPPEAVYRIFGFPMFGIYPSVLQLQLHLPNMQSVTYNDDENLEDVVSRPASNRTTLTEYFSKNREERATRKILYREFPEHYRWIAGKKVWQGRKQASAQIGRIVYANPAEGERYFLRVLLNHVRGATSFEDLRTVAGVTYSTFREACEKRRLIETDRSIDDCLTEATTFQMPCALRRLFATMLVFDEATNIHELWDKHKDALGEDFSRDNSNTSTVEQMVLRDIRDMLHSMGKDIGEYGLPPICDMGPTSIDMMKEVREEQNVPVDQEHLDIFYSLNKEQREGFDEIIQHVFAKKSQVFLLMVREAQERHSYRRRSWLKFVPKD